MNDIYDSCRIEGKVLVDGKNIYDNDIDVTLLRKEVGSRLVRMWEDRITFETTEEGARVEGYRKDLLRIISLIKYKVQEENQ